MASIFPVVPPQAGEAPLELRKLQRATLNDEVYVELKRAIMAGAIEPGQAMTIRGLAACFGVSLMPVREALKRLVAERILELLPNRSVVIPVMDQARFYEVTRIRVALESTAIREATGKITDKQLVELTAWNEEMEQRDLVGSNRLQELNRAIHHTICQAAGMPMLLSMIETTWLQIGPIVAHHLPDIIDQQGNSLQLHHRNMIAALDRGNPEAAAAAVAADIEHSTRIISAVLGWDQDNALRMRRARISRNSS